MNVPTILSTLRRVESVQELDRLFESVFDSYKENVEMILLFCEVFQNKRDQLTTDSK